MNQQEKQNVNTRPCYRKVIDRTTYVVHVYFKEAAKETFKEKIKRLLQEEAKNA